MLKTDGDKTMGSNTNDFINDFIRIDFEEDGSVFNVFRGERREPFVLNMKGLLSLLTLFLVTKKWDEPGIHMDSGMIDSYSRAVVNAMSGLCESLDIPESARETLLGRSDTQP